MVKNQEKKPLYKKWWFWVIIVVALIGIGGVIGGAGSSESNQANETTKSTTDTENSSTDQTDSSEATAETKDKLTLDDGWAIDKSNPYMTYVNGYVSNNTDQAITNYVQITFTALDAQGANVGDCLANANTIDANGKWKFQAMCSGDGIETVRFKEITGF